jgi:O-antigen/teichoic acid export membrane protein
MPVLFRHLSKEELGVWLLLGQSWAALGIFDLGFGVTLTRRIAFAKGKSGTDPNAPLNSETLNEIADLVATGRRVYRVLALFAFTFSFVAGFFYLRSLDLSGVPHSRVWLAWSVLCLSQASGVWATTWICLLQGVGYIGWDAILGSLVNAITVCLQITVVLLGGGLVSLATVAALSSLAQRFAVLNFARHKRREIFYLSGHWKSDELKRLLPLALRAWLTALGYTLVAKTDQFFVVATGGAAAFPAYRAAFLLVINLHILSGVFAGSSIVFVSHLWQAGDLARIRALVRRNCFIGLLGMACGGAAILALGPALFDLWLGPGNFVGYGILMLFLANFLLEHHANVFSSASRATNDEAYAVTSVIAGALKLGLALLFTSSFGLFGLALSTLLALGLTNHWFMVYRGSLRLGINLREHLFKVILPILLVGTGAFFAAKILQALAPSLPTLSRTIAVTATCGLVLALSLWGLAIESPQRARLLRAVPRLISRRAAS